jgi:hypothetical protein
MDEQLFNSGQLIVWRRNVGDTNLSQLRRFKAKYGDGPFLVKTVIEMTVDEQDLCDHLQWVSINTHRGVRRFSGFWFVRKE